MFRETTLGEADLVVLPGGFAHGDYLRCGAIARFSPIMGKAYADRGGLVYGICNGFQILCEAGLLPGALIRNSSLEYRCIMSGLKVEPSTPAFSPAGLGAAIRLPNSHGEGNFRIDEAGLAGLEANRQILLRYTHNPNGSLGDIAGIRNQRGNVFGMMLTGSRLRTLPFQPGRPRRRTRRAGDQVSRTLEAIRLTRHPCPPRRCRRIQIPLSLSRSRPS